LPILAVTVVAIVVLVSSRILIMQNDFGFRLNQTLRTRGFERTGASDYYNNGRDPAWVRERLWGPPMSVSQSDELASAILRDCNGCKLVLGRNVGDWTIELEKPRDKVTSIQLFAGLGRGVRFKGRSGQAMIDIKSTNYRYESHWDRLLGKLGM
jgi:hypothetical protein